MSNASLIFSKSLEEEFFIKGEYLKRHFEDMADQETIGWLMKNCFNQPELENFVESDKHIIIRECIFKRDKETKGEEYIENITIPFSTDKKRKWVSRLHKISSKYKVYAPELLMPYDFLDVLKMLNKGLSLPPTRLFENEPNAEYIYQQYGYTASTKGDKHPKNLIFEIHFSSEHEQQQELIQKLAEEVAIFKKINGIPIDECDSEYLKFVSDQDKSKKFRSNALYNRAIGVYAWDTLKESGGTLEDARKKLINLGLYRYNKKNCSLTDCGSCASKDNCCDAFGDNYRIAAASISQQKIVPTSQKTEKILPKQPQLTIKRVPLNYLDSSYS